MNSIWPSFSIHRLNRQTQSAYWTGEVRPQFGRFRIEIRYRLGDVPHARVLRPALIRLPGNIEGQLPHVYPPADDPTLCLFDPATNQWDPSMTIATTTVPWACDWIACYELWLMTGRWTGGGRHGSAVPGLSALA
ncbi:hypothetical protein ABVV53_09500 [Novosphingobium sp. RD2P27]|uniref:Type II CBASS E2 protein domain-containing protein n=1 Tax=Novosphingobium kalidii TaxID=3230299 RepID=A0ABV2D1I2_9SPHN